MKQMFKLRTVLTLLWLGFSALALAQQTSVTGNVKEADSGDPIIGGTVQIKGKLAGTTTDIDGNFTLKTTTELPFTLVISGVGVESQEVEVTADGQNIEVSLPTQAVDLGGGVVVAASRVEEKILESPVTIEKLDAIAIRQSSTADYYDELTKLKGVHTNQGSLTFTSINTRGFASIANTRFVQLMDGQDNAAPLLNFPTGNIVGISELDIKNIELVPGAASALYGPNAFNGILLMESKSPFTSQGLSALMKFGMTESKGDANEGYGGSETNRGAEYAGPYQRNFSATTPLYNAAVRYAKAFNDKFAFKINFSVLSGQDWPANDYTTDRVKLNRTNFNNQGFDGMNTYGDEIQLPVGGTTLYDANNNPIVIPDGVTRTGWREEDLLDSRKATSLKADAALHYRITDNMELSYAYRFGTGNSVYQGSERYVLRDFTQQFHKLELKGSDFFVRGYASLTGDGDSYNLTALGSYMNESIMSSTSYAVGYELLQNGLAGLIAPNAFSAYPAFRNTSDPNTGVANQEYNASIARQIMDGTAYSTLTPAELQQLATVFAGAQGIPVSVASRILGGAALGTQRPTVGSDEFYALRDKIKNGLFQRGGAGFIDRSGLYHVEGNYNLHKLTHDYVDVLVGGNWRQYSLFSDGTVFNEGVDRVDENGNYVLDTLGKRIVDNKRIKINEYGAYVQIGKKLFNDRLKIQASFRYDKNQNFKGVFSPRASVVYSAGDKRQHNFRASYQTGFRNPDTQSQYIYFPTSSILLGGTEQNAAQYGVFGDGAWTQDSYDRFLASGSAGNRDSSLLVTANLSYIKPERLSAAEIGYKGLIGNKVLVDLSGYYNWYKDFQTQINVRNKVPAYHHGNLVGLNGDGYATWRAYTNTPSAVVSWGVSLGLATKLPKGFTLSGNYSYADYSNKDSINYNLGFNTPRHRFNVGLENRDGLIKNFGFNISYRWQDSFYWENAFGSGDVASFGQTDAQVNYTIHKAHMIVKIGCTNLLKGVGVNALGSEFRTNIGGPYVGRMAYIGFTFDEFMK